MKKSRRPELGWWPFVQHLFEEKHFTGVVIFFLASTGDQKQRIRHGGAGLSRPRCIHAPAGSVGAKVL